MAVKDLIIRSLRGGLNNSDPPMAINDDQCIEAANVEFVKSMLGERRRGSTAIDLPAAITAHDRVPFMTRHLPTADESGSELWVFGVTGTASSTLARKTTAWATVTPVDAITITSNYQYLLQAQTLHSKLFLAYKSGQDRLHVWDGTSLRRTGLAEPAAPTAADTAVAGSYASVRYFRVRYVVVSGTTVLRRSEPSDVRTFTPNGSFNGATVNKPASISEDETHWELEASTDNINFYRIARTAVGTSTYTDTTDFASGYANLADAVLSADIGDYSLIPSGRYLAADGDRLLIGGSFEDDDLASRVAWTPVFGDSTGDGNDERLESDKTPYLDLDGLEGGALTGLAAGSLGNVYAFKLNHIYTLSRTGDRERAYRGILESKSRGALHGSVVAGIDQTGSPAIYFLDPSTGPCRIGQFGIQSCGADILETWRTINLDATQVLCCGLYYPEARQVHWWIATDDSNTPNMRIVLQTNEVRNVEDGARRGWTIWTGDSCGALACCLYSDNIDDNAARNRSLKPFVGLEGNDLVHRTDTGTDDNGTAYAASITTKPYATAGIMNQFGVMSGWLVAKVDASATITIKITKDFGLESDTVSSISLAASGSETHVIKQLDNLSMAEMRTVQVQFLDPSPATGRWELVEFSIKQTAGQTAGG